MKEFLCIGRIVKPQGIRGEVKVLPFTDDPERFHQLAAVWLDERGERSVAVVGARVSGGDVFLQLDGIADRNAAEGLRGVDLYIDRQNAVQLPEGRYFIADMIGLKVLDEQGEELGILKDIAQAGGNDVYSVAGKRSFLFPAVKRAIERIDIAGRVMVLRAEVLREIAVYDDED